MQPSRTTIGMLTIGQAPRDDVVPALQQYLPDDIHIVQYGALDGLLGHEIQQFATRDGEVGIVTRLQDGSSVLLSHKLILPAMQAKLDAAVNIDGVELIVVLCGADWSALNSAKLIVNPGRLFPAIVSALAAGRKLGIIKPSPGQIKREQARYAELGIDATVTAASPYSGALRLQAAREAAIELRAAECELVWMTCVGMDIEMHNVVAEITGTPIILAHRLLARLISELVNSRVTADSVA